MGGHRVRTRAARAQGSGKLAGVVRRLGEERTRGSGAGHEGAQRSRGTARLKEVPQFGAERQGGWLEVVGECRTQPTGVPGGERGD